MTDGKRKSRRALVSGALLSAVCGWLLFYHGMSFAAELPSFGSIFGYSTLAVQPDGTLWGWGDTGSGLLGDWSPGACLYEFPDEVLCGDEYRNFPVPVRVGTDSDWKTVAVSRLHALGVKDDGSLWAWGSNPWGVLGLAQIPPGWDEPVALLPPLRIGTDGGWKAVGAGWGFSFALKTDGTLWGWGWLCPGQPYAREVKAPVQVGTDDDWKEFVIADQRIIALKENGTLWGWGDNIHAELGLGDTEDRTAPTMIGSDSDWVTMSAGRYATAAIKSDGSLWVWGWSCQGRLGDDGETGCYLLTVPTRLGNSRDWTAVAVSDMSVAAVKADGTLWRTGYNGLVQVGTDSDWVDVAAGYLQNFAVKESGGVYAWDDYTVNSVSSRNLGTDRMLVSLNKPAMVESLTGWEEVSTGQGFAVGVKEDGTLWSWGQNASYGTLGLGDHENRAVPARVGDGADWLTVDAGTNHTLAVKQNGTLWSWGSNAGLELGRDIPGYNDPLPGQVGSDTDWTTVAAGYAHSLALKSDGSLWAWGRNIEGQLGFGIDPAVDEYPVPVRVGTLSDWTQISAGFYSSGAVRENGTAWVWGNMEGGQYGNFYEYPTQVTGSPCDACFSRIEVGTYRSTVLIHGALMNGGEHYPPLSSLWKDTSPGKDYHMLVGQAGSLFGQGSNSVGQLGLGSLTGAGLSRVGTDTDWRSVSANPYDTPFTLGLKENGELWSWGSNRYGNLGLGYQATSQTPLSVARVFRQGPDGAGARHFPISLNQVVMTGINEDMPVTLQATDEDGDSLTLRVITEPMHGALSGTPPNLVYTPERDYEGLDRLVFRTNDGMTDGNLGIVKIAVTPHSGPPAAPTPIAPLTFVDDVRPTFTWGAVAAADRYFFLVNDSSGAGKIRRWYTAAEAGCPDGTGPCSISVPGDRELAYGPALWMVRASNSAGDGPWSAAILFTVNDCSDPDLPACSPPMADITANSSDGPLVISRGEELEVVAGMTAGAETGATVEWWAVARTPLPPPRDFYSYDFDTGQWKPGITPAHQGACKDFAPRAILNMKGLPAGTYMFYFGIDTVTNGKPTMKNGYADRVQVTITD